MNGHTSARRDTLNDFGALGSYYMYFLLLRPIDNRYEIRSVTGVTHWSFSSFFRTDRHVHLCGFGQKFSYIRPFTIPTDNSEALTRHRRRWTSRSLSLHTLFVFIRMEVLCSIFGFAFQHANVANFFVL